MRTTPTGPDNDSTTEHPTVAALGDYLVPVDPMEDLGCDACQ